MKYSQKLVWESVYVASPHYQDMKNAGMRVNLPDALKDAAVAFFLIENSHDYVCPSSDFVYAKGVVYDALTELRTESFFTFGTIDEFWGEEK